MTNTVTLDLRQLQFNIDALPENIDKRISGLTAYYAGRIGSQARTNAAWTDRTSNARNGLIAGSGKKDGNHYIVLAHRVPYGIWLEVRWSGKYAIILPTLQSEGPKVMQAFEKMLDRYQAGAS